MDCVKSRWKISSFESEISQKPKERLIQSAISLQHEQYTSRYVVICQDSRKTRRDTSRFTLFVPGKFKKMTEKPWRYLTSSVENYPRKKDADISYDRNSSHAIARNDPGVCVCFSSIYTFFIISRAQTAVSWHLRAAEVPDRNLFIGSLCPLPDPPRASLKRPLIKGVYINNPRNTHRRIRSACACDHRCVLAVRLTWELDQSDFSVLSIPGCPRWSAAINARRSMYIPQTSNGNSLIQQSSWSYTDVKAKLSRELRNRDRALRSA